MPEKEQFVSVWEREFPTTIKVLKSFPVARSEFRPHERSRSARELAWIFAVEEGLVAMVLSGNLQLTGQVPAPPETWDGVLAAYEKAHAANVAKLRKASDGDLQKTSRFPTGPGTMAEMRNIDIMWFMLMDSIHHRGQFSVYLRMAGGKVPSIYGPSADEPWM